MTGIIGKMLRGLGEGLSAYGLAELKQPSNEVNAWIQDRIASVRAKAA